MRAVIIGCVETSRVALQTLASLDCVDIRGVVTRSASDFNSDFVDLRPIAEEIGAPVYLVNEQGKAGETQWISDLAPDVIYCIGWSWLLPKELLTVPAKGTVGYHPSALPANRGRHPIVWALALGLTETASTFFLMNEEADGGDILSQVSVPIAKDDTARDLYDNLLHCIPEQIVDLSIGLATDKSRRLAQDPRQANNWRKRTKDDGRIDWRMSAASIYNLVRALAPPYPGAHFVYAGREVKVLRAEIVTERRRNVEPGKIIDAADGCLTIKCGEDAIRLVDVSLDVPLQMGAYL